MQIHRVVLMVALAATACGPSHQTAVASVEKHDENLRARAGFDMSCPKEQLQIQPLKKEANAFHPDVEYTVLAGVSGCGKRATYVFDQNRNVWLLNGSDGVSAPAAAAGADGDHPPAADTKN